MNGNLFYQLTRQRHDHMTKKTYLEMRHSLDLKRKLTPLLVFFMTDLILCGAAIKIASTSLFFLDIPLIAILMFRNFSLMHDACHNAISDNLKINDLIGFWCGVICLLPYKAWRNSHLQHHLWSGNVKHDPVMALRIVIPQWSKKKQRFINSAWTHWLPLIASLQYLVFWKLSINYALKSRSSKTLLETVAPLAIWIGILGLFASGTTLALIACSLFVYMIVTEIVNLPHHLQLPLLEGDKKLPVWEQYRTARSCIYPKWIAKHLLLNFNLHSEHHMFPDAPWYTLHKIHNMVHAELGEQQAVDLMFDWSLKNRSLPLVTVLCESPQGSQQAS